MIINDISLLVLFFRVVSQSIQSSSIALLMAEEGSQFKGGGWDLSACSHLDCDAMRHTCLVEEWTGQKLKGSGVNEGGWLQKKS
jgi:hypothetical protein